MAVDTCIFCLHLHDVIPWEPTKRADFVCQVLSGSWLRYEWLEDLMDFLALVVQKLRSKIRSLFRETP